ncbi:hypothetical protein B0T11DRAFT_290342 [Plectosphaerella cucumerina]|jgi:hypothetical protein|uniref:Uncharacterized protein n=1 Tax=Plectosphaerella cucumerina TaxID=40658 RepID=A0A8K0T6W6_9PEZI|nr:hypothetical protein B0T11DRAFT_290342 [Plectosphaerella cucumerina]
MMGRTSRPGQGRTQWTLFIGPAILSSRLALPRNVDRSQSRSKYFQLHSPGLERPAGPYNRNQGRPLQASRMTCTRRAGGAAARLGSSKKTQIVPGGSWEDSLAKTRVETNERGMSVSTLPFCCVKRCRARRRLPPAAPQSVVFCIHEALRRQSRAALRPVEAPSAKPEGSGPPPFNAVSPPLCQCLAGQDEARRRTPLPSAPLRGSVSRCRLVQSSPAMPRGSAGGWNDEVCFWTKARPVCRGHVPQHLPPSPSCRPFSLTAETDG